MKGDRFWITLAVMAATVIQVLDTTIVNVALPHMAGELGASIDQISWVLTSYIVASSVVMPMTGFLTDRLGRRKYLLISIAGFVAASAACGVAGSLAQMVLFRLLQGVFGASLVPLSQAIMVDTYPSNERGKALAIWGMGVMVAPILGPTIGGYLTETIGWRWTFYINIPIGIASFLLASRSVVETEVKARSMDWTGLVLLSLFIAGLQYVLDRGQQSDWFDATSIKVATIVALTGLVLFIGTSIARGKDTLFDLRVFLDRNFTAAAVVGGAMGLSLFGGMLLQPLLLENLLHFPTFDTGLAMVPRGVGSLLSMLLIGRLIGRIAPKRLIFFGIGVSIVGSWMMTRFNLDIDRWSLALPLFLQGVGIGFVFVPLSAIAFSSLPRQLATEAAGVYNLIRSIGGSIGISLVSVYMTRSSQASFGTLRGYVDPYRTSVQHYLDPLHLKARGAGLAVLAQQVAEQAQLMGMLQSFWLIVGSFVVMIPLVMLLKPGHAAAPTAAAIAE